MKAVEGAKAAVFAASEKGKTKTTDGSRCGRTARFPIDDGMAMMTV
jgi:hypothetical protein